MVFEGTIHKCPNCGDILDAYESVCEACGYERRGANSTSSVRELAVKIFKILDCRGLSCVDFFVKKDGSVLFNEINTFPGFTVTSMYPKMMTDSTYSYPELVTELIELAFEK